MCGMHTDASLTTMVSLMWFTVAILAGGYARTRNRSAWTWFVLTLFLGPLAAYLVVVWPPREPAAERAATLTSAARRWPPPAP